MKRCNVGAFLADDSGSVAIGEAAAIGLALIILLALKLFWANDIKPWLTKKVELLV